MKGGSWICPSCGTENPLEASACSTCPEVIEPDELAGATHLRHLAASLSNSRLWRVASSGLGYVVVAARSRDLAAEKGVQILGRDAQEDQTVTVTEVSYRGWLVYVRSALTPYPSARKPWQAERRRKSASFRERVRKRPVGARPAREPVEGRAYIGQVLVWLSESRCGTITCSDQTIGNVTVRESGVRPRDVASMRAGRHVTFTIEKTPDGLLAVNVRMLGPPPG
jgi:cold shock CspA family protein